MGKLLDEISSIYDTSFHPDVVSGKATHEEVVFEFIAMWDNQDRDGIISKDEFVSYYKDVSASIDDDAYFGADDAQRLAYQWGRGAAQNTSNIRCLVTYEDGSQKVVEVLNDFGVRRNDMIEIKAKT